MIIVLLCIFFISISASYAINTNEINSSNLNTSNSNGLITSNSKVNTAYNSIKRRNEGKAAGEVVKPDKLSQSQILLASKNVNSYVSKYKKCQTQ